MAIRCFSYRLKFLACARLDIFVVVFLYQLLTRLSKVKELCPVQRFFFCSVRWFIIHVEYLIGQSIDLSWFIMLYWTIRTVNNKLKAISVVCFLFLISCFTFIQFILYRSWLRSLSIKRVLRLLLSILVQFFKRCLVDHVVFFQNAVGGTTLLV